MTFPYRDRTPACGPGIYKYHFSEEQIADIWERLEKRYGIIKTTPYVMEIESESFFFRSTHQKNPITVVQKRRCKPEDVQQFHMIIQYEDADNS